MPEPVNFRDEYEVPLAPGQLVGNYLIESRLARGGMGEVFRAVHQHIERRAAIKVLYPALSRNPQLTSRFLNEARAVNLIRHPGLVEVYEFGVMPDGMAYLVMELLEGESLTRRMTQHLGRSMPGALLVTRQIAQALHAAHRAGIVHRDLKPDNVMLVPPHGDELARPGWDRVKILDFGIAKVSAPSTASPRLSLRTQTGVALGTPEYMSPEQCVGTTIDGKADVYSLGVMLFEMLTGRLPFLSDLAFDLMAAHVRTAPPALRDLAPGVSVPVAGLVAAMLSKDPVTRPTMAEVAAALEIPALEEEASQRVTAPQNLLPEGAPTDVGLMPTMMTPTTPRKELPAAPRRILLIDDEHAMTQTLKMVLEARGFQCQTRSDGAGVLDHVRTFKPDLVVLDVELPGRTGYKLCWEIKSTPETASTRVLFLSGKDRQEDHQMGMAMKADAYMDKPFQVASLLSVIELLLSPLGHTTP